MKRSLLFASTLLFVLPACGPMSDDDDTGDDDDATTDDDDSSVLTDDDSSILTDDDDVTLGLEDDGDREVHQGRSPSARHASGTHLQVPGA